MIPYRRSAFGNEKEIQKLEKGARDLLVGSDFFQYDQHLSKGREYILRECALLRGFGPKLRP
jgi:hypothetical protein